MPRRRSPLVLLVDDNPDLREMLKMALEAVDHLRVIEAATSKTALLLARRHKLDLVISDLARPGMNGLKFLKVFKRRYPHIPVIIASGDPDGSVEGKVKQQGAFGFIAKPFLLDALHRVVKAALAPPEPGVAKP